MFKSKIKEQKTKKIEKKRISISVNGKVIEELRERNFNISSLCDSLLDRQLKLCKQSKKNLVI